MTWQPYESRGIVIDMSLADRLSSYLESKEVELCTRVAEAISFSISPSLIPAPETALHLHEVIEGFRKKIQNLAQLRQETALKEEWKIAAAKIQESLWKYIEVLEGSTTELFQQLDQISFEQWNTQLLSAMGAIKETLMHRMDDLRWAIKCLDQQLREFRSICKKSKRGFWRNIGFEGSRILDSSMEQSIAKCQKLLRTRYQKFTKKYTGYLHLYEKAEQSLQKLHSHRRLATLDLEVQNHIKKIYELLKMWEYNLSSKILPKNEITGALKNAYNSESILSLFCEYYSSIKRGLFDKSRMIKKKFREVFHDFQARQPIIHNVIGYCHELQLLGWMCKKYREFLLATGSNSYARSRLRLSQWIAGTELKDIKQLQAQILNIEHLNTLCESFQSALESDQAMLKTLTPKVEEEIANYLSEMSQPLASKATINKHAKMILAHLKNLDELMSFHPEVVNYTCKILCKIMRADWKYHVLHEISLFHQLYDIHHSIVGPLEERQNADRLDKFKVILDRLDQWIKHKQVLKHAHEVNLGINDIKAYLQDFFAGIQGLKNLNDKGNEDVISRSTEKIYEALLEYRYVFSKFFHHLRSDIPEERLIRKQFLFADQYFEAIENRLQDITSS